MFGFAKSGGVFALHNLVSEGCVGTDGCVNCILPIVRLIECIYSFFILHVVFGIDAREVAIACLLIAFEVLMTENVRTSCG